MTEPVSVSGEAITDQSISETAKAGKVALTFIFGLTEKWGCSVAEQKLLLGLVSNATYYRYKKLTEARLSDDLIERIWGLGSNGTKNQRKL
ncbi:antitoxin Xre-like helix-turn-helix domain-containing protein [Pseudomonas monteilii]|uniref:antitoxin Xre-like helix-turn-helix domain-containing protein n=2 Tax=Pseudomonas putida group TaxID=136845 RepID=UPI00067D209A|nr:antitoxin Xre-like helix-turn-helix domain-containing protein [Pseudomonas monteilii]